MNKKIYVIGDIHGCIETLKQLYSKLDEDSMIISVGDLVDKGPNAMDVVDFCIDNNITVIKGNHEHMFVKYMSRYLAGDNIFNTDWYLEWGGKMTVDSYKTNPEKIREHINFFNSLPLYKEVTTNNQNFFITHGFALPYYDIRDTNESYIPFMSNRLYGKYFDIKNINELEKFNTINIFGHDSFINVQSHKLYYAIDTGCVYDKTSHTGGCLTTIELNTKEIISVDVIDIVNYH